MGQVAHKFQLVEGGCAIPAVQLIEHPIAHPLRTREKWLSVAAFSALAGIAQQNVNKAIGKGRWRGADLIVRQVEIGRGGASGMAPQVHVDSLPADLREAWYLSQGIKLDEAVDPATGEVRKLPEAVTQHDPKWDERVAVAQWRLNIIRQVAAQPKGSPARKAALDVLAGQIQVLPDGKRKVLSRSTLYNWIAAYDAGGLLGLMPETRKDAGQKKTIVTMVWDGFFSGRITPPDHQRIGDDVAHYIRRAASLRRADPAAKPL